MAGKVVVTKRQESIGIMYTISIEDKPGTEACDFVLVRNYDPDCPLVYHNDMALLGETVDRIGKLLSL